MLSIHKDAQVAKALIHVLRDNCKKAIKLRLNSFSSKMSHFLLLGINASMYSVPVFEVITSILSEEVPNKEIVENFVSLLEIIRPTGAIFGGMKSFAIGICVTIERFIEDEKLCLKLISVTTKYLSKDTSKYL